MKTDPLTIAIEALITIRDTCEAEMHNSLDGYGRQPELEDYDDMESASSKGNDYGTYYTARQLRGHAVKAITRLRAMLRAEQQRTGATLEKMKKMRTIRHPEYADALLIAKAPELLVMLKRALDVIDAAERTYKWAWADKNEADVLIAEAEGRKAMSRRRPGPRALRAAVAPVVPS